MRRFPVKHSRRDIANHLQAMDAFRTGSTPVFTPTPTTPASRKKAKRQQPEALVNQAVKDWARARGDVTLWRNNVGSFEWRPGRWMRFGLCVGSSDHVGFYSTIVTPDMVGKRVAVLLAPESKAENGVASEDQLRFIEQVRDAGGISGIVRNAEDCEGLVSRWRNR